MSNTSKILLTEIMDEVVIKLLTAVIPALKTAGVDYFAIGAFARDVKMLDKGHTTPPVRKTKDIDLAVIVGSLNEYEKKGQVELLAKNAFTLNMPGFDLVRPFAETVETEEGLTLNVSSLSGIVLLKLLAWQDNAGREKDIHDISYILKNFMSQHLEEIAGEDLMDLYKDEANHLFDQIVSARYIGRQMGIMLQNNAGLTKRVQQLLDEESKKSGMARLMPQEYIEDNQRIITALLDGMNDTTSKEA